jgi:hypothetical protein
VLALEIAVAAHAAGNVARAAVRQDVRKVVEALKAAKLERFL